jgi:hypothetical protein
LYFSWFEWTTVSSILLMLGLLSPASFKLVKFDQFKVDRIFFSPYSPSGITFL